LWMSCNIATTVTSWRQNPKSYIASRGKIATSFN